MKIRILFFFTFLLLMACKNDTTGQQEKDIPTDSTEIETEKKTNSDLIDLENTSDSLIEEEVEGDNFLATGFEDKKYYELLIETRMCDPKFDATNNPNTTPCSSKLFSFHPYNHKREIDNAFLLQVKAGVNNYPYRRLLIFVRERGQLVLMNGIVGYLVERIPQNNDIDDLVVAVIDDLGNDIFDRYDVLLRYKDGKYHFVEALGDLEGTFDTPELKKKASKAIKERIEEKELIF